jgi:hypothetical protein
MVVNQILRSITNLMIISFYCHGFEDDAKGSKHISLHISSIKFVTLDALLYQ